MVLLSFIFSSKELVHRRVMKLAKAMRPGGREAGTPAAAVWSQAAVHVPYLPHTGTSSGKG